MVDCLLTQIETNKKLKNKIGIECLIETALGMSNIKKLQHQVKDLRHYILVLQIMQQV